MLQEQRYAQVRADVEPLLRIDPRNRELLLLAARAHHGLRLHEQALALCSRAAACSGGADAEVRFLRGEALRNLGRTDEALADFAHAARLDPHSIDAPLSIAATLEEAGRPAEARIALDAAAETMRATGRAPSPKFIFENARLLVQEGRYAEANAAIDALLPLIPAGFRQRRTALQLRVKACDRSGDFAGAWDAAQRALSEVSAAFDPSEYSRQTDAMISYWTPQRAREAVRSQELDPTAIFIAGMPRSGTTLVEQLIAAHPLGAGVGELRTLESFAAEADAALVFAGAAPGAGRAIDQGRMTHAARGYLEQVRDLHPGARRIANKSLMNVRMAAHLAHLFPATRILHIQRDPRDVAVSCVLGGFNLDRMPWTARADWAAHAWAESERLMRHWRQVLDVPILQLRYEELVREGPAAFRRIIEFVGLPWDDAVTQFHATKRTVQTLSYDQVNKPLYTSAVARWKNYEAQLAGIAWPAYP